MPTPRIHDSQAARQRAYAQRIKEARLAELQAKGLPAAAPIPTMPSHARWRAAGQRIRKLIDDLTVETQIYWDDRSESWQESQAGQDFQEKIERLEEAKQILEEAF